MNSIQLAIAITSGICFYVGIYHGLVGLRRRPRDPVHLLFALASLGIGLYNFGQIFLHPAVAAGSATAFIAADRWSLLGLLVGVLFLLWFIAFYTKVKQYLVLITLSVPILILLGVHLTSPATYLYTDVTGFFDVTLPWGEVIRIADIEMSPWAEWDPMVFLTITIFSIYAGIRQYRRGERRQSLLLGLALTIFIASYVNDTLLDYELITSIYVMQFGYVALIAVMSLVLTDEIVYTERELEALTAELDQRVTERTAELSATNRALAKAKEAAEAANRAKSTFLANMSHELRTPLNAILGFTQIIERDADFPPQQSGRLEVINRSGEHLLAVIDDVLEISAIEAGRSSLDVGVVDLYRTLGNLETMMRFRAENKGLDLVFQRADDVPRYIRTDERKLRQVLVNLLGNALKFTDEGRVTLRVSVTDDGRRTTDSARGVEEPPLVASRRSSLVFEVEDTGEGIAPEEIALLFEPFTQTRSGRQAEEGTGLGLPISREFVHLMGGQISVRSIPQASSGAGGNPDGPHGTIFTFDITLELAEESEVYSRRPTRRVVGLAPDQRDYRILIVDDSADNRALLREILEPVGFDLREAVNGQEAVEVYRSWEPHLIWMDVRMPVMDGHRATQAIRAGAGPETVIIAVTASAFEEDRTQVLASGVDDFVRKPFQEQEIFDTMAQHLGVRYVFAAAAPQPADVEEVDVTAVDLASLPAEWVAELRQAALRGHGEQVLELLRQLEPEHAQVAQALSALVRQYQFGSIVILTEL